jgi:2-polyprenyl-3-methyl-5-hydroxy-6-metoxy-1,4-benzoquinol methylase
VFRRAQRAYLARAWGYRSVDLDVASRYLGSCLTWLPQHRARLEASVFYLYGDPLGKLLDVGCGSGDAIVRLRALGWDAEGVDFDARAVETARGRGLTVAQGTMAAQHYAGATFAAIVMNHVMEHVHDPRAEFDECFRLLEPGGRLVVVTPNAQSWLHRTFGRNWRGLEPPRHIQVFTRAALGQLATACGFQVQHLATTPKQAAFFFAASRSVAVARRRGTPSEDRFAVWAHRFGACMAAFELALLQVTPDLGEELALVARKPLAS